MNIFLTGATGYIGAAVARVFLRAGHSVWGLARRPERAQRLRADGMNLVVGELRHPASYRLVAERCDAIVHAGFEFGPRGEETDRVATESLASCLDAARGPRHFVYTSGVWVLGARGPAPADEDARLAPPEAVAWRPAHEALALAAAHPGLTATVVRPGCVYGGQGGLYGMMFRSIFEERVARVVGDGENCWAAVYLDDLAELYRLVVEKAAGGVFHATDGSADPVRAVAESFLDAAGGGELERVPLARARAELGPVADALTMDQRVSSEKTRRELGWRPLLGSPALNAEILLAQWHDQEAGLTLV